MKYIPFVIIFGSFMLAGKSSPVEENRRPSISSADGVSYEQCGRLSENRVSGTEFVSGGVLQQNPFAYPWSVAIVRVNNETDHDIHCHGSLIALNVVLSAAHCYKNKTMIPELFVVLGALEPLKAGITIDKKREINYIYEIKEVIIHKEYHLKKKEAYYDVSLTILKEKIRTDGYYSQYIHPICLPIKSKEQNAAGETKRSINSQQAIVTGYITNHPDTTGKLNFIGPIIQTQAICNEKFSNFKPGSGFEWDIFFALPRNFTPALLCATIENSEQGTCRGDSGGPLFRHEFHNGSLSEKRYVQIGVVHGSVISCSPRFPGIYARLEEPSILDFVKSLGRTNNRTEYIASANVDCRWSLWSECDDNSMQSRRITRPLENNGKDCENKTLTTRSCERQYKTYTCPGGAIIPKEYLCDGRNDCRDNSDELNCPAGKSKLFKKCLHIL